MYNLNRAGSVVWLLLVMLLLAQGCKTTPKSTPKAVTKPLYENNFEAAALDQVPAEMLVLDGGFAVKAEGGNKFLELPGAPLETYGVLFGPSEPSGIAVTARFHGTGKGRRFPTFGVGLNGVGGYRLQVSPGKKLLELYKGDAVIATAPFTWTSDAWTQLRLQSRKTGDGRWKVEGKGWKHGDAEPAAWTISFDTDAELAAGKASIWGAPYSTTPIRFDDLVVSKAAEK